MAQAILCIPSIPIFISERPMAVWTFRKVQLVFRRRVANNELFGSWIVDDNGFLVASSAISSSPLPAQHSRHTYSTISRLDGYGMIDITSPSASVIASRSYCQSLTAWCEQTRPSSWDVGSELAAQSYGKDYHPIASESMFGREP